MAAGDGSVRCFYLNHAQAELAHITVSNGLAEPGLLGNGGGVYLNNGTVTNCAITHCAATNNGGGIYMTTGLVAACAIHDNQSRTPTAGPYGGGGI